jgi:hypothetical protein
MLLLDMATHWSTYHTINSTAQDAFTYGDDKYTVEAEVEVFWIDEHHQPDTFRCASEWERVDLQGYTLTSRHGVATDTDKLSPGLRISVEEWIRSRAVKCNGND